MTMRAKGQNEYDLVRLMKIENIFLPREGKKKCSINRMRNQLKVFHQMRVTDRGLPKNI